MQLWVSPPLGCSELVVVAVVADQDWGSEPRWGPAAMPESVRVLHQATAELVAEMLHDATQTAALAGREPRIDLDALIGRATRATATVDRRSADGIV